MAIIKSKHASNYTVIPNEIFDIEKTNLSLGAIGLLCKFLSMPHNWVIYKTSLPDQLKVGKDKLNGYFKELQNAGYILTVKKIGEKGHIEYDHIVYDKPFNDEPCTEKPLTVEPCTVEPITDKPSTVNPPLINKDIQSKQEKSKKKNKDLKYELKPNCISDELWIEFVNHRKGKKADITKTVMERFIAESKKANITLEDAIKETIYRNWQGFKAEWYIKDTPNKQGTSVKSSAKEII